MQYPWREHYTCGNGNTYCQTDELWLEISHNSTLQRATTTNLRKLLFTLQRATTTNLHKLLFTLQRATTINLHKLLFTVQRATTTNIHKPLQLEAATYHLLLTWYSLSNEELTDVLNYYSFQYMNLPAQNLCNIFGILNIKLLTAY
jgi:hypothetical protein